MNFLFSSIRRRPILSALLLLGVMLIATAATYESVSLNRALGRDVARFVTTNTSVALRIKYIGTAAASTQTRADVGADGKITFNINSAADSTIGTAGVVDTTAAANDTFGELADTINASANWRCILVDVLASQSCNNTLTSTTLGSLTTTNLVSQAAGHPYTYDSADLDMVTASVGPEYTSGALLAVSNNSLLNRLSTPRGSPISPAWQNELLYVTTQATYTSGAPNLVVYACQDAANSIHKYAGSAEILLWQQVGAATTVASTIPILPTQAPIKAPPGWRLLVGYIDTSTPDVTAGSMQIHGLSYNIIPN